MSAKIRLYQVDVFTANPMTGNAAGVVPNADSLSPKQMQAIARELNNSETAFLLKPRAENYDVGIRYFTPTQEVPSCGHATIAAHFVRAIELGLAPGRYWHRIGIGRLPVDIETHNGNPRVIMTQGTPEIGKPLGENIRKDLLEALAIPGGDVSDYPLVRIDTGASKIMLGVASRAILNGINPDNARLASLGKKLNAKGFFVFTLENPDPGVFAHARMFAPQIGIPEDPVTGNGNGPLGIYLTKFNLIEKKTNPVYFRARQGEAMLRPGTAHVWVEMKQGTPKEVRVGGDAVIVFSTTITI